MSGGKTYVNNAYNRSVGRVGMSLGSAVVSRSSGGGPAASSSSSYRSSSGASRSGSGTYVDNSYNRSVGRVGKEYGTAVVSKPSGTSSVASSSSPKTYVDNPYNRKLDRVGLEHGTAVLSKSSSSSAESSSAPKTYVDNYQNRKLCRVGEEHGTRVVSKTASDSTDSSKPTASGVASSSTYVDNAYNRRLGRVGKPKGSHVVKQDGTVSINGKDTYVLKKAFERKKKIEQAIENNPLCDIFDGLNFSDQPFCDVEDDAIASDAARVLRVEKLEEGWKENDIIPQTDSSKIVLSSHHVSKDDLQDLRLIGRGSFGIVYAALWKTTKTPVAYKQFASQSFTKKKIESFVREVEIFSKLVHRNIVKMFGAVLEDKNVGIVMEYCKKTLFDALFVYEDDNFTPLDKLRIVAEVGSALEYLHTHEPPIAHCDIKSQNILLDGNCTVKVCDFGLSVIKNTVQSSRSTKGEGDAPPGQGTPRYSAPEVLRGELLKLEDLVLTDIYSLSLVTYEVIVVEEPYEMLNPKQLAKNVGYGDLRPSLDNLQNSNLKVLLQRCWSKIPHERPGIKQFNKEWAKLTEL